MNKLFMRREYLWSPYEDNYTFQKGSMIRGQWSKMVKESVLLLNFVFFMFIWDIKPIPERPRGNKECPRLYGLFPDPRGCGRFFKCVNGTATEDQCGTTLIFDDKEKVCKDMTKEEIENCQEPNLLGCTECEFVEVLQLKIVFYI